VGAAPEMTKDASRTATGDAGRAVQSEALVLVASAGKITVGHLDTDGIMHIPASTKLWGPAVFFGQ